MYYGDKRSSLVVIANRLSKLGWNILGYKHDDSDGMTDYFDPASWEGIAEKNGYILVIDCESENSYTYKSGKPMSKYYYYNRTDLNSDYENSYKDNYAQIALSNSKAKDKINKLLALANDSAATEGEKNVALLMIEKIKENVKLTKETITKSEEINTSYYPIYMPNPKNRNWHIERNGKIIGTGIGIFGYSGLHYKNCYNSSDDIIDIESIKRSWKWLKERQETYTIHLSSWKSPDYYTNIKELKTENEYIEYQTQEINNDKTVIAFRKFIDKIDKTASLKLVQDDKDEVSEELEKVVINKTKIEKVVKPLQNFNPDEFNFEMLEIGDMVKFVKNFSGINSKSIYKVSKIDDYKGVKCAFFRKLKNNLTDFCVENYVNKNAFYIKNTTLEKYVLNKYVEFVEIIQKKINYTQEKWVKKDSNIGNKNEKNEKTSKNASCENCILIQNECITIQENANKNGIEIIFKIKPKNSVIEELKSHHFRWSKFGNLWYNKNTLENKNFALSLA